jgi:hypothetical protein
MKTLTKALLEKVTQDVDTATWETISLTTQDSGVDCVYDLDDEGLGLLEDKQQLNIQPIRIFKPKPSEINALAQMMEKPAVDQEKYEVMVRCKSNCQGSISKRAVGGTLPQPLQTPNKTT